MHNAFKFMLVNFAREYSVENPEELCARILKQAGNFEELGARILKQVYA